MVSAMLLEHYFFNNNQDLGFTPCKAEQPLQGMELHEKEAQKDYSMQEISLEGHLQLRCLLILDLKPFRLYQKKAFYRQRIPESTCARTPVRVYLCTSPDVTTVFHTWVYGRFIEIQSSLWRKKLHRTNYGSNFLGGNFGNRGNV